MSETRDAELIVRLADLLRDFRDRKETAINVATAFCRAARSYQGEVLLDVATVEARLAAMERELHNLWNPAPPEVQPSPAPRGPSEATRWPSAAAIEHARFVLGNEAETVGLGTDEQRHAVAAVVLEGAYVRDVPAIERAAAERGYAEGVRALARHLDHHGHDAMHRDEAERFLAEGGAR